MFLVNYIYTFHWCFIFFVRVLAIGRRRRRWADSGMDQPSRSSTTEVPGLRCDGRTTGTLYTNGQKNINCTVFVFLFCFWGDGKNEVVCVFFG